MLFNSIEFLIFLPIVFAIYWMLNKHLRWQNAFIVCASYLFYGWWDWKFLILIVFTSLCSWSAGLLIEKHKDDDRKARKINVINICINLLILGVFKYYNFFVESFTSLFPSLSSDNLLIHVILPVGISFYTFQALSYSIDVYRGKIAATKDIIQFLAFVSFFPQLVAGPIERATNLLPQFAKQRLFDCETSLDGLRQILWGLFKKMVVADNCAIYVNHVFETYSIQSGSTLFLAAILFSFQIYGDFSGYSDIAIGTAKIFGIKLMRNFNVPYFSRDIAEFWRRWHISLTSWFRDYVYIPLGGSRVSKAKIIRNTFIIFLLSGFWHGANWTFIAWGAYHALLFLPLILLGKNRKHTDCVAQFSALPSFKELFQIVTTFILVVFGWIIFRSESISQATTYISRIFTNNLISLPCVLVGTKRTIIAIFAMLIVEWVLRKKEHGFQLSLKTPTLYRIGLCYIVILVILEFAGSSQSFIYFQF